MVLQGRKWILECKETDEVSKVEDQNKGRERIYEYD